MTAWAMRRDSTFVVELFTPLNHAGRVIDNIVIQAPRFEHSVRWQRGEYPSALALLSELCGVPERVLRQAMPADMDRMHGAIFFQAKFATADVLVDFKIPFASPEEALPSAAESKVGDPQDWRFPAVEGPVRRFPTPPPGPGFPQPPQPPEQPQPSQQPQPPEQPDDPLGPHDDLDLGLAPPDIIRTARNG